MFAPESKEVGPALLGLSYSSDRLVWYLGRQFVFRTLPSEKRQLKKEKDYVSSKTNSSKKTEKNELFTLVRCSFIFLATAIIGKVIWEPLRG